MVFEAAAAEGATAASVATAAATASAITAVAPIVAAAAGSIASQLVGMALGVVDEFSWKAVALSAISAGVTQGLPTGAMLGTTAGSIGNTIVRAAVANAMTQGIAVAVGLQDRFDWKGVAASAIGAGVGASVSEGLGITDSAGQRTAAFNNSSMGEQVFKSSLTGLAAGTATALARGGRVSVQQIASDAFGNALGSSLGAQIVQGGQQEDRLGNFINEQEAAQTQRDNAAAKTSFRQSEIAYQNESESAPTSMGGGSGLRLGGGGIGINRFPSSAVKDWSDGIDGGIMLNGSIAPAEERRALRTYTVQPGDNPASIGVKFFGDSRAGATILADNGLDASVRGTRNLPVGTVLTLRDDISEGNLRAGGRLIGADTSIRAQERAAVAEAQATADQARYDAMRMGAWSGRTNQPGSSSVGTGAGSSAGGHFETMPSMDIAGGGMTGGTEQVWVSDGPAMAWGQSVGNAASAVGNGLVGVAEVVVGGAYNYGVRLAGGAASIPYVLNSVDAAVAVQEGFKERFGYDMRSSGAFAIGQALQPIGQWTQNSVMTPARGYSEALIGNGATTILGGVAQAGLEIVGVVTGGRAAQSFLENSVFVTRPVAGLYGGIPVDALFGSTRITTVTAEMSERFQGMGYVNPLTNKFTVAPLGETMAVDHIFPSTEIVQLRGFNTLTKQQMTSIIQDSTGELGNLQPLPKTFNSSKGSDLNWTTYKGQALDSTYVTTLEAQQRLVRSQIQSQIRSYQQQNLLGGR